MMPLILVLSVSLWQMPDAARAIAAARNARTATEAAQKKNADALDPPPAQAPAPQTSRPTAPPSATAPAPSGAAPAAAIPASAPPAPGAGYTYDPDGRRDPFVSLLNGATRLPQLGPRPAGLSGLTIGEITVKGLMKSPKGGYLGLVQGPDNKTYVVHAGDKVLDGSVKMVAADAIVFSQDVNDPLSLVKQREVRKSIRPEAR